MSTSNNPVISMIQRIRQDIFDRMYQGRLNYSADINTIRNHAQIAQELGDCILAGRLFELGGFVELTAGHLDRFEAWYERAYQIFAEEKDPFRMGVVRMNHGESYRLLGQFEDAIRFYQEARHYFEEAQKDDVAALLDSNMGLALLGVQDYAGADAYFRAAIDRIGDQTYDHVDALMEARRGMAEVELQHGDFAAAWRHIEEALELARGIDDNLTLAEIHLTRAHIAEADPSYPDASTFFAESRTILSAGQSPVAFARALLEEARYQYRHGNQADAEQLALEAEQKFLSMDMQADAARAKALLAAHHNR